eukprot:Clim_evm21s144 gene=Clim_evmTU21s144
MMFPDPQGRDKIIWEYWFQPDENGRPTPNLKKWFMGGEEVDKEVLQKFGDIHAILSDPDDESTQIWETQPRSMLAKIIALDQFSRSIHRGKAEAFAQDAQALHLTHRALHNGWLEDLNFHEIHFTLMPLMHSENIEDHELMIRTLKELHLPDEYKEDRDRLLVYEQDHADIVRKFGRYPYRNDCLGRECTAEEKEYLKTANRFGQ